MSWCWWLHFCSPRLSCHPCMKQSGVKYTFDFGRNLYICFLLTTQLHIGRIVNIGSIHSLVASPAKVAYVTFKHALVGLTKSTAVEGGPHGVTANCICPSYVRTPLVEKQIADQAIHRGISEDEVIERVMLPSNCVVRRLLEPVEVAELCTFLCSDAAQCITGSEQKIDCGWTSQWVEQSFSLPIYLHYLA